MCILGTEQASMHPLLGVASCCEQELEQRRALQQLQLSEELRASRAKVEELEQRLLTIRRRTDELRKENLERQLRLRDASQQVGLSKGFHFLGLVVGCAEKLRQCGGMLED